MKNLQVIVRRNIDFKSNVAAHCVDLDNGILFILTTDLKLIQAHIHNEDLDSTEQDIQRKLSKLIGQTSITPEDVRLFEYVVEAGGLLLALRSGHLVVVTATSNDSYCCIYKHARNISSISLSPAQDLIALADDDNNIQIMYCSDCDIIQTSNALTQNESLNKPVGVGWGSKETQFFGLDGRPSQEKQQNAKVQVSDDEVAISDQIEASEEFIKYQLGQERSTVIDWRGDGQLIATLTYLPDTKKHYLKVWNRNLELQFMSEQLVTVERGLLCWIPDGRYICCAQRRDRRLNELAIFERNGLVRQRLTLPTMLADSYMSSMAWSPDSKILAIVVKRFFIREERTKYHSILMMYTMQNWHYYLKSSMKLKDDSDYSLKWDTTNFSRLHVMSNDGVYHQYDCSFQVTYCDRYSTVAVIDGNKVQITSLEKCVIPPPMSAITLETKNLIYRLSLYHTAHIYILTLDGKLIYTLTNLDTSEEVKEDEAGEFTLKAHLNNHSTREIHDHLNNYRVISLEDADLYQHLVPIDEYTLIASKITSQGSEIVRIKLPANQTSQFVIETLKTFNNKQVTCISQNATKQSKILNIILNDSSLFLLNADGTIEPTSDFSSTIAESRFSYSLVDMKTLGSSSPTSTITLGHDLCLRYNNDILATNCCTSFRITANYLVYTTSENTMNFILLKNLFSSQPNKSDSWAQQIESGGTIVIASETDSKVVLQMPRGNLETIHPRVLLFSRLTDLLDQKRYLEACRLARRHRVNMNFVVDYLTRIEGQLFYSELAKALVINDSNLLCLIITELENADTITGRYQSIMKHIPKRKIDDCSKCAMEDKVGLFCRYMNNLPDEPWFLFPRIQILLKMEPKMTGLALEIVDDIDVRDDVTKTEAMKYILYFIDIDQLFNEALGTYKSNIALMVASVSNKDPKQYLALLDNFNSIENEHFRCYKIDMHIKRYDRAFDHLHRLYVESHEVDGVAVTIDQVLELVVSKRIYKEAIKCLTGPGLIDYEFDAPFESKQVVDSIVYKIWTKYGDYLLEKRHYDEAGLAYSKAFNGSGKDVELLNSALKCFSFAEDWEKSMALITRSQVDIQTKQEVSKKLVNQLFERGKYHEAVIVEQMISCNFDSGIDSHCLERLVGAGKWFLAEIYAGSQRELFLKFSAVKDIERHVYSLSDEWSRELNTAKKQFERLKEVLTTQKVRQESALDKGFVSDTLSTVDGSELSSMSGSDNPHVIRVARSGATSIKTRNTSKSSKPSRKRINLKAGSRHEDIALVMELKSFIQKQKTNREECARESAALFQYLASTSLVYEIVESLNGIMNKSLKFAEELVELLWPSGPHLEQRYSLYNRHNGTSQTELPENIDFEILIRPELPKCSNLLEM